MDRIARIASALALACSMSACEVVSPGEDAPPDPAETVGAFIDAWNEEDFGAMGEQTSAAASYIELTHSRVFRDGLVEGFEVAATGEPAVPGADEVAEIHAEGGVAEGSVPYEITYTSSAAGAPVVLSGTMALLLTPNAESWRPRWTRGLLFPGVRRADSFAVRSRWLKRGALRDRNGRVLARGRAEMRSYPHDSTAGTTIGHLEPLKRADLEDAREGAQPGDLVGASGLERAFDEVLAGEPSTRLAVVTPTGRVIEVVGRSPGKPGRNVKTTLDLDVQRRAEAGFGSTTGGAVVLDPTTGDILAAVSSSPFDPGNYVGVGGIEPFNRALSGLYPPGSAMKVMTAGAALDAGVVSADTRLTGPAEYRGVRNFESGSYPSLSFATAVQNSVNTAFAQVALKLGAKRITRYAEAFGFNRKPGMALDAATSSFPMPEDEGDLMWGSIGQAQTLATPLQMATVAATVANDGKRMEPRILMSDRPSGRRVMSRGAAGTLTTLMEGVVQAGTGTAANVSGARVAGKTGTAEVDVGGERRNHAWFICFAPAPDPEVAVAVVAEYGGIGGQVAAPLARNILLGVMPIIE